MPAPYPQEFREDVVRVACSREDGVTLAQIAKDFGIHEMTLHKWIRQVDLDDGNRPGCTREEATELREARAESACWSGRTRSCAARLSTSPGQTYREKALPARE